VAMSGDSVITWWSRWPCTVAAVRRWWCGLELRLRSRLRVLLRVLLHVHVLLFLLLLLLLLLLLRLRWYHALVTCPRTCPCTWRRPPSLLSLSMHDQVARQRLDVSNGLPWVLTPRVIPLDQVSTRPLWIAWTSKAGSPPTAPLPSSSRDRRHPPSRPSLAGSLLPAPPSLMSSHLPGREPLPGAPDYYVDVGRARALVQKGARGPAEKVQRRWRCARICQGPPMSMRQLLRPAPSRSRLKTSP